VSRVNVSGHLLGTDRATYSAVVGVSTFSSTFAARTVLTERPPVGSDHLTDRRSKLGLVIYLLLAFAITWATQIPGIIAAHNWGLEITNEANVFHLADLFTVELAPGFRTGFLLFVFAFGPTIAGIVVTAIFKGREGLKDLLRWLVRIRILLRWIGLILLIPVLVNLGALFLGFLVSGLKPIEFSLLVPLSMVVPFFLYMLVFTAWRRRSGGGAMPSPNSRGTTRPRSRAGSSASSGAGGTSPRTLLPWGLAVYLLRRYGGETLLVRRLEVAAARD
jgi:hypothetical protein